MTLARELKYGTVVDEAINHGCGRHLIGLDLRQLPRRPPKVYQAWPLESVPGSVATSKCTTRVGGHFKVYQLT